MKPHRAFSLIELLVVISIIALILAILLPSLSGARRRSWQVRCLTNLRNVSMGWDMYASDHDDVSVPGRMANLGGGTGNPANYYDIGNGMKYRPRWIATMGKYVGLFAFDPPVPDDDRQDYDGAAYRCPEVPERVDNRNHAYGYNYQFLGNARKVDGRFVNFPVIRTRIPSFASTVLGADCLGTAAGFTASDRTSYENDGSTLSAVSNHGWALDPPRLTPVSDRGTGDAGSPRTAVDPRHLGRANVVYCDGHGEAQTPEALGYRTAGDGTYLEDGTGDLRPSNRLFSGRDGDVDPPPKTAG